jgi:predicted anti-sigma-YlaC factor YlaD
MCSRSIIALWDGWALLYVPLAHVAVVAFAYISQMTWVFVVMGDLYDIKKGEWHTNSHSLLSTQELWFAVFMTIL